MLIKASLIVIVLHARGLLNGNAVAIMVELNILRGYTGLR